MPFLIRCRPFSIHIFSGFSCGCLCCKGCCKWYKNRMPSWSSTFPGEKIGRHKAALYRSLTEKSCAQPLVPRCCSQLFCQLSLSQSKGRNELPTDYGTKTRRKPKPTLRSPGVSPPRKADRQNHAKLNPSPPRRTRYEPVSGPAGFSTTPCALHSS